MGKPWERDWQNHDGSGGAGAPAPWERDWSAPGAAAPTSAAKPGALKEIARNAVPWLGEGVNNILGAVPQLMAPDSSAAEFFKNNAEWWRGTQSQGVQDRLAAANQRIDAAGEEGVLPQIGQAASEYWNDPVLAARLGATNLPSMVPGLALGKAAQVAGASAKLGAGAQAALGLGTAGATNAALNAGGARGDAFDEIKAAAMARGMSEADATELALEGSKLPAAVGAATGYIGGRTGLEKAILGRATAGQALKKAAGAFGAEIGTEQLEEVAPKLTTNLAAQQVDPTRKLGQDVGRTIVETAVGTGPTATIGGAAAGYRARQQSGDQAAPAADVPLPAADVLGRAVPATDLLDTAEPQRPERIAAVPGAPTTFATEAGARMEGQYALVEADDVQASHDTELRPTQPSDKPRAEVEAQVSGITKQIDPPRLGWSDDAGTGAPVIDEQGKVEDGNARTIALQRVYSVPGQKAHEYKTWLGDNAAAFGLSREQVEGMRKPMLVRVRSTPVPADEAAELLPVGEATEVESIPTAETNELPMGQAAEMVAPAPATKAARARRLPTGKATELEVETVEAAPVAAAQAEQPAADAETAAKPAAAAPIMAETAGQAKRASAQKVYKTRTGAEKAKKEAGNTLRIRKVKGGFILREATDKELAAAEKAGRRLAQALPVDVENDSLLTAIAKLGGIAMSERKDTIGEGNRNIAGRMLFTANGKPIDLLADENLRDLGYVPQGEVDRDGGGTWLRAAIAAEFMGTKQHFSERGTEWMEEAQRQREAEMGDPDALEDFTPDELDEAGYTAADPAVQQATEELLSAAEALGIDTEALREDAARLTADQPEAAYHAEVQRLARNAIEELGRNAQVADAEAAPASAEDRGEPAGDESQEAQRLIGEYRAAFGKTPSGMDRQQWRDFHDRRRAAGDALDAAILSLAERHGGLLLPTRGGNSKVMLHADPRTPGAWRTTTFENNMEPAGHMEFNTPIEAAYEFRNMAAAGDQGQEGLTDDWRKRAKESPISERAAKEARESQDSRKVGDTGWFMYDATAARDPLVMLVSAYRPVRVMFGYELSSGTDHMRARVRAQTWAEENPEQAPTLPQGELVSQPLLATQTAEGKAAGLKPERPSGNTDATLARFRPRQMVIFSKPYVGKTGAKLVGYEWKWRPEAIVDNRGEDRTIRVSDWEEAITNPETNRDIVHQFQVERTDGSVDVVSAETAANMLGVSQSTARNSAKRLLEEHMRAQRDAEIASSQADAMDALDAKPTPAGAVESGADGGGYADFYVRRVLSDGKKWGAREDRYERQLMAERKYRFLTRDGRYLFSPELAAPGTEIHKRGWRTVELRADAIWTATGADKMAEVAPLLSTQTAEDLKAKTEREAAAKKADADEQKRLADKAKADAQRDEFVLTGSDRAADVAAAAGQQDIFGAPPEPQAPLDPDATRVLGQTVVRQPPTKRQQSSPYARFAVGEYILSVQQFPAGPGVVLHVVRQVGAARSIEQAPNEMLESDDFSGLRDTARDLFAQFAQPVAPAEKPAKAEEQKPAAPRGTVAKAPISDFGAKLEGARKDYAATLKDAENVDIAAEPLSKSWPEPDYQKMLDAGVDPFVVAFIHAARDEIPTKPQKAWKLKGWVDGVKSMRETARSLLAGEIKPARVREIAGTISMTMKVVKSRAELYELVGHGKSLKGISFSENHYSYYRGQENVRKWVVEQKAKATAFSNWPRELAVGDTKQEMLDQFAAKMAQDGGADGAKAPAKGKFVIYRKRGQQGAWIGKKIGREYVDLRKFDDVAAARKYLDENTAALEKALDKYKETPFERKTENAPRVGDDHRNGAPVTPEVFADTFGFRGVQFGNYVEQGRRQSDLNEAYDGLMDLAAVLGVPPRALSLNGRLGLAFGARGRGGKNAPAAHFEPDRVVINLTKGGGPGSLAHELWHSFDNYFAANSGTKGGFITGGSKTDGMRAALKVAFDRVKTATQAPALRRRAAELDKRRSAPYWNTPEELSARAFESYVIAKLRDQGAANDYLANIVDEKVWNISEGMRAEFLGGEAAETYPYPLQAEMPAVRAAFDDFFKTVETRTDDAGNVAMYEPAPPEYAAPYEQDLFGNQVSPPTRANRRAASGLAAAAQRDGNVDAATGVQGPPGAYATRAALVTTRRQQLGHAGPVGNLAGAANALAYLNKSAVERLDALVTNAKGKPLAVIGGFKGALNQAAVYPATLLGEALMVPGAANVWLVHNHPSGAPYLSNADVWLADSVARVFSGTGIKVRGMIAVGSDKWGGGESVNGFAGIESGDIKAADGPTVPAQERQIQQDGKLAPPIGSPLDAKFIVRKLVDQNAGRPTIVLMDSQHAPIAAVPWEPADALPLRNNGKLDALLRAVAQSNAGVAIIGTGRDMTMAQAQNIGAGLAKMDVRVLDIIDNDGASASEQGLRTTAEAVLSRRPSAPDQAEAPDAWVYRLWGSRTWRSEADARDMIRRRIIEDNERYAGAFKPNDPALADGLVFEKAPTPKSGFDKGVPQVKLKQPPQPKAPFSRIGEPADSDGSDRPRVDWTSKDLADDGTAESVLQAYGRGEGNVYRAWVDTELIPVPKGSGIVGGYPDMQGDYDWRELAHRGEPPPLKLRVGANGKIVLMDGNHRLAWWRENGHSEVPAYVIDERKGAEGVQFSIADRTGSAGGMPLAAAKAVADRAQARMRNLPPVEVLQSAADLPADSTLRQFIEDRGAMGDVRGALHDGTIYLFADNLEDEATAEHVLAEHEAAHAGLRGLLGRSVDAAMRTLYESNPRLRNQVEALIQQGVPLAEAVEEVIVDIPSAELVKLKGWRRFTMLVRDALRRAGLVRLALRIDGWLSGRLTEQQRADLMVADLVREARAFVAGRPRRGLGTLDADGGEQSAWLAEQAKQRGFKSLDDMIERDYEGFDGLAAMWRARNPAPAMLPRAANPAAPAFDADSATVIADFRNDAPLKAHADYKAAKAGDVKAAANVVRDLVAPASTEAARKAFGTDVIYVAPHAEEAAGAAAAGMAGPAAMYGTRLARGPVIATEEQARSAGFTLKAYRGVSRKAPFNDTGTTWLTTSREVAEVYAEEVMGYEDPDVLTVMVKPDGLPRHDASRLTDGQRSALGADGFGNPQALGIYDRSDDHPLGGSRRNVTVIHAPREAVVVIGRGMLSIGTGAAADGGLTRLSRAPRAPEPGWAMPEGSRFDDFVYKLQDKHVDLKRAVGAIVKTGQQIEDRFDAYLQEELFHERAAKRTQDFVAQELAPLLEDMKAKGVTQDALDAYLHARHATEANKLIAERNPDIPDGGSGMTDADADAYMAGLKPQQKADLDALAAKVDAIIAKTRDTYVGYGLESKATVDGWAKMFKHYVPLMREDHDGGMGIGQGFSVRGPEAKHRTGSTAKVVDILANIALQREKAIVRGEKNRVAVALAGLVKTNPNPEVWAFGTIPKEQVFNPKTGKVEERADPLFKSRPNALVAKIVGDDGQVHERAVIFNERSQRGMRMAAALKNLDAATLEGVIGLSAKITRYFAAINTQYNPVFGAVNLVRDFQGALINLSSTPLAAHRKAVMRHTASALKGIYKDARQMRQGRVAASPWADLWEEFQKEGGATGFRDLYRTSADRAKAIEHALDPHKWMQSPLGQVFTAGGTLKVPMAVAQDKAGWLFDWLSDYNQAMENAVRVSAYKVALEQGMSKQRAANLGKNLTVNFNRKGQAGMQAGALYAFFNAAMQGTARMADVLFDMREGDIRTLRLSKIGKRIVAGGVLLGAMNALMLAAAGFDDEEPPEFVRERNLVIPIGGKKYIAIPMPLGWHVLHNLGRVPTEFMLGGFKDPAKHVIGLMGVIADAFNPIGNAGLSLQTLAPTALDPLAALAENRDWTGRPIAMPSFNDATPGFTRAKDTATAPARRIAEAINWISGGTQYQAGAWSPTPDQIDYLWGQVTGGVGREAAKAEQTVRALWSGEELPPHKIPLVGRFFGDTEGASGQAGQFYTNLKVMDGHEAQIKGLSKAAAQAGSVAESEQLYAERDEYMKEHPEAELWARANVVQRRVRFLRERKRELVKADAPRSEVKAVEDDITQVMREFNDQVRAAREPTSPAPPAPARSTAPRVPTTQAP